MPEDPTRDTLEEMLAYEAANTAAIEAQLIYPQDEAKTADSCSGNYGRGDVVQVIDENHPWYGCLLTVSDPKSWGIQGFVQWPLTNDPTEEQTTTMAYNRLRNDQIARVGASSLELA